MSCIKPIAAFVLLCSILAAMGFLGPLQAGESDKDDKPKVPFSKWADDFARWNGTPDLAREQGAFDIALHRGYLLLRLGAIDLWFPRRHLQKKQTAKTFKEIGEAILLAQKQWISWTCDPATTQNIQPQIKTLTKWVKGLNFSKAIAGRGDKDCEPNLLELNAPSDKIRTAAREFTDFMTQEIGLGRVQNNAQGVSLILAPTREEFVGLGAFIGSLSPNNQSLFWRDNLAYWTRLSYKTAFVIALEHPLNAPGKGDISKGLSMNKQARTGMLEHVVQHAMDQLIRYYFAGSLHIDLAKGLAQNMVIELYGRNNVRAGGGHKRKSMPGRSVFVAGATADGRLPAGYFSKFMESRWRETKGKDYFRKALQDAQKKGIKTARKEKIRGKDPNGFFALEPESGSMTLHLVQAPILQNYLPKPALPAIYKEDFLEFLRAYRSAFAYWLMNKARNSGSSDAPAALFQHLISRLGRTSDADGGNRFENIVMEIYGLPLTPEPDRPDSLEGLFLAWLATRR